jgi:membrane-bound lytic murein transglycosylase MltF
VNAWSAALVACAALAPLATADAAAPAPAPASAPQVEEVHARGELPTAWGTAFGDLDAMRERRVVRALVAPNRVGYFVQGGRQYGANYEWLVAFEKQLNAKRKKGEIPVRVAIVPTAPDTVVAELMAGHGDIAAVAEVETPTLAAKVDFVAPIGRGQRKLVVTRDDVADITSLAALGEREVWVRRNSSAQEQVAAYNAQQRAIGGARIKVVPAPTHLHDEDLLEMVNAGLIPAAISHEFLIATYKPVYKRIKAHPQAELAQGEALGWAIRKDSPLLKQELDRFWKRNAVGSTLGNVLVQRYLKGGKGLRDATSAAERKKFEKLVVLFRKEAQRYHMDHLLMIAQGYQESQLEQDTRSSAGAIGVMQVLPSTGKEMKVGDITKLEPNVRAGVKYMRWIIDNYFTDPAIPDADKVLFAFASYNAGPNRIRSLRAEAKRRGLDPNRWFGNVEIVVSHRVGREPVDYVANIYKYYVAYKLIEEQEAGAAEGAPRKP